MINAEKYNKSTEEEKWGMLYDELYIQFPNMKIEQLNLIINMVTFGANLATSSAINIIEKYDIQKIKKIKDEIYYQLDIVNISLFPIMALKEEFIK